MSPAKSEKQTHAKDRAVEIANTFEWLITAFILAFVFRAFIMEAYRIPTGSMADTLRGAHFRLRCLQCGYKYRYGLGNYGLPQDTMPAGPLRKKNTRCPSCGYYQSTGGNMAVSNGDRILVLKCIYQFFKPKRWDVVVFKNPLEPQINFIKRLVALPGETVEIIDGDIYINGRISRKPRALQEQLWMPVYDNDYQPVQPRQGLFNGHFWKQPFDVENSKWVVDDLNPTMFRLDSPGEETQSLVYDSTVGNDFRAAYAYDDMITYKYMPHCSDLMMRFYARFAEPAGSIGIALSKYQTRYKGRFDSSGRMTIVAVSQDKETLLAERYPGTPFPVNKPVPVQFSNVDHLLTFRVGDEKLTCDLGPLPEDAGPRETDIGPRVEICGSGKLTLSHVAVFRDIYYISSMFPNGGKGGRAGEGNPFALADDEFFMLGDNSPNSHDGRWWSQPGIGNNSRQYRTGIVPREYLVGKALFVYWPGGFKPTAGFPFAVVPNVGQMRFIYGGSRDIQ